MQPCNQGNTSQLKPYIYYIYNKTFKTFKLKPLLIVDNSDSMPTSFSNDMSSLADSFISSANAFAFSASLAFSSFSIFSAATSVRVFEW